MPVTQTTKHFSTVTNSWETCTATVHACKYGNTEHRVSGGETQDKADFYDSYIRNQLPETVVLYGSMEDGEEYRVAEPGSTAVRCGHCDDYLSQETVDKVSHAEAPSRRIKCEHCDAPLRYMGEDYIVELKHEEANLIVDDSSARSHVWFHATTKEDWAAGVSKDDAFIHAGSREAALQRMQHMQAGHFYLYELKAKSDSEFTPDSVVDESEWPSTVKDSENQISGELDVDGIEDDFDWDEEDDSERSHDSSSPASISKVNLSVEPHKINRYVNMFEAKGSVSVIASLSKFDVIGMTKITS